MRAVGLVLFFIATFQAARAGDPFAVAGLLLFQQHERGPSATRPLTLAESESAALANNPEIAVAARRLVGVEARAGAAGSLEDFTFQYRGWGIPFREPWNLNRPQNMFMLSQPLPGPGKSVLRYQIAAQEADIAKWELESKKREVLTRVRQAFYELLRNRDELRLHDEQVAIARQAMEAARIKYVVGRVPQQDVLKAQMAVTRLAEHLIEFHYQGRLAVATLNTLIGRDPGSPLEVAGQYALPARLPSLADLERLALENRPELLAATAAIRQSETKEKLARKAYTPDFSVGVGYMAMPPGSAFRNTYMAEFSLTLPWLNRRRHDAEIREAQAGLAMQRAEYENLRAMVFREIQEALVRADAARQVVGLYRDTLRPQAESTLHAAVAAYQTDRTDFLNLLDSQNALLDIEHAYSRGLAEFDQRLAELERAAGAPLPGDVRSAGAASGKEGP